MQLCRPAWLAGGVLFDGTNAGDSQARQSGTRALLQCALKHMLLGYRRRMDRATYVIQLYLFCLRSGLLGFGRTCRRRDAKTQ